jgi:uncharacterized membrane protein YphA (DoxX/SURF4 family)
MTSLSTRLVARQPWLSTAARALLAGVLALAGWPKLLDPEGTVRSVRAFQLVPESLVRPVAYGLPMLELTLAAVLLLGLGTRLAGAATAVLMLVFLGGIASAWVRGLSIDCGCFGDTGALVGDPVPGYVRDILRDLLFLGAALLLALRPRSRYALDGLLGLHPEPAVPAADRPAGTDRPAMTDRPSARRTGAPDVRSPT